LRGAERLHAISAELDRIWEALRERAERIKPRKEAAKTES
jgi:hypothetical protein